MKSRRLNYKQDEPWRNKNSCKSNCVFRLQISHHMKILTSYFLYTNREMVERSKRAEKQRDESTATSVSEPTKAVTNEVTAVVPKPMPTAMKEIKV
jgi:biotin synthase-like enzyme